MTVTLEEPGAVAVPPMTPQEMVKPAGSPEALQVYAGTPPVAETVALYGEPAVALATEVVVTLRVGAATVTVNALDALVPVVSVTVAVTE